MLFYPYFMAGFATQSGGESEGGQSDAAQWVPYMRPATPGAFGVGGQSPSEGIHF